MLQFSDDEGNKVEEEEEEEEEFTPTSKPSPKSNLYIFLFYYFYKRLLSCGDYFLFIFFRKIQGIVVHVQGQQPGR